MVEQKIVKALKLKDFDLEMVKEENYSSTRFVRYQVLQDGKPVMTSFHYNTPSSYFDMLAEERMNKNE